MVHAKISVANPWAFTNVFSWEVRCQCPDSAALSA
jgi:hypothetical protein